MDNDKSLQELLQPDGICFGCGPANPKGLHLRSFVDGDHLIVRWTPGQNHQAFPGVLNGGIIGTLIDCSSNWAAVHALMERDGEFAMTVTAEFRVALLRPTPIDRPLQVTSRAVELDGRRVTVEATLVSEG